MGSVVLAPSSPPPAAGSTSIAERYGFDSITWTSWDGRVFDIARGEQGITLQAGVRGLHLPELGHWLDDAPALHGARWRGFRVPPREVFWPVLIYAGDGDEWARYDQNWWSAHRPDQLGSWEVTFAGSSRRLLCRLVDDGGFELDHDPMLMGWSIVPMRLIADEHPLWLGDRIERAWAQETPRDFYDGGPGGVIWISSGSVLSGATIPNPGDVAAWPQWTITAGATQVSDISLGVVDAGVLRRITLPIVLAAGRALTVDTNPREQTVLEYPAWALDEAGHPVPQGTPIDRFASVGVWDPRPIPVGASVPLSIAATGGDCTISAGFEPQHLRAWG